MTTQSISFNSFASLSPATVQGYDVDGVVDGRPVRVRYNRHGGVVPVKGSMLPTPYGDAQVVGYVDGSLRVRITRFDDEFLFMTECPEDPEILNAPQFVATLADAANRSIQSMVSDIYRLKASEFTGKLGKADQEYVDSIEPFASNEFIMDLAKGATIPDDTEVLVDVVLIERETRDERKARKALEIAEAKRLRRKLLAQWDAENTEVPDDVAAEIADEFGDADAFDDADDFEQVESFDFED